jgi:hypothetical protein
VNRAAAAGLLALGLLQMAGDVLGFPALRAIGAASGASPAPKVFSSVRGLETYSTRFFIEWTDVAGRPHSVRLTPELGARLQGPYNRRNVYGAVLAYGPVLSTDPVTRPLFESVARYALCGEAPLLVELGIDPAQVSGRVQIRLEPRPGAELGELPRVLEPPCP